MAKKKKKTQASTSRRHLKQPQPQPPPLNKKKFARNLEGSIIMVRWLRKMMGNITNKGETIEMQRNEDKKGKKEEIQYNTIGACAQLNWQLVASPF